MVVTASSSRAPSPLAAIRSRGAAAAERFLARQASSGTLAAVTARGGLLAQSALLPEPLVVKMCEKLEMCPLDVWAPFCGLPGGPTPCVAHLRAP